MSNEKLVLVVASKLKKHVKEKHGLSCSKELSDALSLEVAKIVDGAVENAKRAKRKTLMVKDIQVVSNEEE